MSVRFKFEVSVEAESVSWGSRRYSEEVGEASLSSSRAAMTLEVEEQTPVPVWKKNYLISAVEEKTKTNIKQS